VLPHLTFCARGEETLSVNELLNIYTHPFGARNGMNVLQIATLASLARNGNFLYSPIVEGCLVRGGVFFKLGKGISLGAYTSPILI